MKIEREGRVISGVRHGHTLGSPITLRIENRDWANWQERMGADAVDEPPEAVTRVRPGHADLTGTLKYGLDDVRDAIERSSSRETAARVAAGAVCRQLLTAFGIAIHSHVLAVGGVGYADGRASPTPAPSMPPSGRASTPLRCAAPTPTSPRRMIARILEGKHDGDTCGGVFEVVATDVPIGLGSYSQWDRRLSGRIARRCLASPPPRASRSAAASPPPPCPAPQVHDVVRHDEQRGWHHLTNNAGGIEGGISNGEPIVARVAVKPIPTLAHPLPSVDVRTGENIDATRYERSDVCVVPAAGVVGEAMLAYTLADAFLEKFGGDSLAEIRRNYDGYLASLHR